MSLAEVEVYGYLSFEFPSLSPTLPPSMTPSSQYENLSLLPSAVATASTESHGGTADLAIDGDTNGAFGGGSVSHTGGTIGGKSILELSQLFLTLSSTAEPSRMSMGF